MVAKLYYCVADQIFSILDGSYLEVKVRLQTVLLDLLEYKAILTDVRLSCHIIEVWNQRVHCFDMPL
jgi:hypothetical protein